MIPISEIKEGDIFSNPAYAGYAAAGVLYRVERVNTAEKMVLIQAYAANTCSPVLKPFWKSNKDRMFSESWRFN